jgi:hypothetical protein
MTNLRSEGEPRLLSGWSDSRGEVRSGCRAYSWHYSAGEAYERIGVDGNHVVPAIGVSCRQRGVRTVTVTKRIRELQA